MPLVTVARYRQITGDADTADQLVSARIEDAVALLADELGRPLEEDERTERMWPTRDGRLWPQVTPIVEADGYTIDGDALVSSSWPWAGPPWSVDYLDVTYTGGWAERSADPTAVNALPACIERDLAWAAYLLARPPAPPPGIPAGASSASLGDASLTMRDGASGAPGSTASMWSRQTFRYRARRVGSYPTAVTS